MNNIKLQAFCLLVEHRKLAPVAQQLNITKPTVSFHIRSIEEEYGIQLFRTNAGGYRLTAAGEGLYHYAKQIVQLHKEMTNFIEDLLAGDVGSIRLGASGLPAHIFMPELIHKISTTYPAIQISFIVKTAPEIEELVAQHELDFGFIMETKQENPLLVYETIGEDTFVLAFSPKHELASKHNMTKADILQYKILLHTSSSSTNYFIEQWLGSQSAMNKMELDSISTIKKMLTFGTTVAFLSAALIEEELRAGSLVKKDLADRSLTRKIQFIYSSSRLDSPIDVFVKKAIGELQI